jgi:hypothetical protein
VAAFACVMEKSLRIMHDTVPGLESNDCDMPFQLRKDLADTLENAERTPGVHLLSSEFELTCPTSDEVRLGALLRRGVGATVSGGWAAAEARNEGSRIDQDPGSASP